MTEAPLSAHQQQPAEVACSADAKARLKILVDEHYDFIWRLVRRLGVPHDSACDVVQEVFMVAMKKLDTIKVGSERSFLFGTALRMASDFRRARARSLECGGDDIDPRDSSPSPEEMTHQQRMRRMLDAVLDAMAPEFRAVFVLYELEGMTTKQIAEWMEIPHGTASSRLRLAREEYQKIVQRFRARGMLPGGGQ